MTGTALESATTPKSTQVMEGARTGLFVAGQWRPAEGGGTFTVEDPGTGEPLCEVADATPSDASDALGAAAAAQAAWGASPPSRRSEILQRAYDLIVARTEELAMLMTLEMGKPLAEARSEVAYAAEFFRWFAAQALGLEDRLRTEGQHSQTLVQRRPVGPSILITPFNFPLAMGARKIGPAVAAGCTMVVKPAQQTPLSMLALADVMREAGLPAGVLNVIPTTEPGATIGPLIADARTRKISFTGSTAVGKDLTRAASDQLLRLSMELGGNAPFLVFADADLDAAVEGAVAAKMRNAGQACIAANRFLVERSVHDEFTAKLAAAVGALRVGRGTEEGVEVGPLIDSTQRDRVSSFVAAAIDAGAEVVTGGGAIDGPGCFFEPTVLSGLGADDDLLRTEIFGPVAPIVSFAGEEEALAVANATEYGLAAYVYTRDAQRARRVADGLDTGMVAVNQGNLSNPAAPFGGVKQSGFGREGGLEGLGEYLESKYLAIQTG